MSLLPVFYIEVSAEPAPNGEGTHVHVDSGIGLFFNTDKVQSLVDRVLALIKAEMEAENATS